MGLGNVEQIALNNAEIKISLSEIIVIYCTLKCGENANCLFHLLRQVSYLAKEVTEFPPNMA